MYVRCMYVQYLLNTDDINYANKTLSLCMYECMSHLMSVGCVVRHGSDDGAAPGGHLP